MISIVQNTLGNVGTVKFILGIVLLVTANSNPKRETIAATLIISGITVLVIIGILTIGSMIH